MNWRAALIEGSITALNRKRRTGTAEHARTRIEKLVIRPKRFAPSRSIVRDLNVEARRDGSSTIYTMSPQGAKPSQVVLYLHGGSYTFEISPFHWKLLRQLVTATPAIVIVPIYTLAPQSTAAQTVPAMTDLAQEVIKEHGADRVTLMGDSAGGGMALAVAQQLRDRQTEQPSRIGLIAPWLDVTLTDPRQRQIEPRDRMLSFGSLAECGRLYAGALDVRDPMVSPLYGDMRGLAPIDIWTGSYDILNVDAHRLVDAARAADVDVTLHEHVGMQHAYPLLPLVTEGREARDQLVRLVRG